LEYYESERHALLLFSKLKEEEMKKLVMALITGSAISTAAFAAEPAANPMVLSDNQMDVVTAGGYYYQPKPTVDNSGKTTNVNIAPTFGSVNIVPIGRNSADTTGATTNQGGNGSVNGSLILVK
jgi:hypothetical protein